MTERVESPRDGGVECVLTAERERLEEAFTRFAQCDGARFPARRRDLVTALISAGAMIAELEAPSVRVPVSESANLRSSAFDAITAAANAKLIADRGIPRAVVVAARHGLSGDDIRQAFERAGLDYASVLPLVQGYEETGDAA